MNRDYKEGQEVCVNVEQLHFGFGNKITYGTIENEADYFDLYNEDGELACMSGEKCIIEQVGSSLLTLINENGEGTIHFTLTKEEADLSIFM